LFEKRGWDIREMEKRREKGDVWFGELIKAGDLKIRKVTEIRESRWFREIKKEGV